MATLVSLQLVRVAGVGDYHATTSSYSVPGRRSRVVLNSRLLQGSGYKIASHPRVGSLQGGGAFCCPLWSHLLISKSNNARVRTLRLPIVTSSIRPIPMEQQIKQIAVMFVNYGGHLLRRAATLFQMCPPLVAEVAPGMGLVAYSIWGLGPMTRMLRKTVFKRNDKKWDESRTYNIMASYMRPILLWIGIILICRAFDPVMLSTEASQAIKQRFVNFVRSLSTVLAFAFCTASLTQQVQRFMMENQDAEESRNVGVQFIGNTVYTSVWVAAVCLFMELLGFSTQKWITAGGFGTVLITLAGREIFTNFLSSIMIHATRPFVDNEWIQTKIEGQEVSGTVELVGWWSPTVIRGDDREAVHIPNHKFSVSVVRNLSQKTHWRIKTHLGISHLDVSKMTPIVADMRKVLAKHPQVEQQRLHRRVFFDQIDPENQALMILISCFVKTSHFEEYLRVKEIILLDLLKVISHHGARLATPIRSVQRVLDETESRSAPFRDMRNANQTQQRRPFLLSDSQVASADDDEDDDDDDISDTISRLSEQIAKSSSKAAAAAASTKDNEESEESSSSSKDPSHLKAPGEKPKEVAPVAGSNPKPRTGQQNADQETGLVQETASDESDVRENLMARIYAGTEERLVKKSHTDNTTGVVVLQNNQAESNGKASTSSAAGHPVAATTTTTTTTTTTHVPATELVVELPEEKVPHLYSNNVGLDDVSNQKAAASIDNQVNDNNNYNSEVLTTVPSLSIHVNVHTDIQDVKTAATSTEDHQELHATQKVNDNNDNKHVLGVHVADGGATSTTLSATIDNDDPWKQQPSTPLERDETNEALGGATTTTTTLPLPLPLPASSNDPWRQPSTTAQQASNETVVVTSSTNDDPWTTTQPSSHKVVAPPPPPSRPTVDPNLIIPGVAIEGPKHTLPLDEDEDIITLDDSPTLVAHSSKESRRESNSGPKGAAATANDTRDRER